MLVSFQLLNLIITVQDGFNEYNVNMNKRTIKRDRNSNTIKRNLHIISDFLKLVENG